MSSFSVKSLYKTGGYCENLRGVDGYFWASVCNVTLFNMTRTCC